MSFPPFTHTSGERAPVSASVGIGARSRAFAPEYAHRHYRQDGRGLIEHRHEVRSARHGHMATGLLMVNLTWIGYGWNKVGGAVLYVGTAAVYVGLAVIILVGFWYFAGTVRQ